MIKILFIDDDKSIARVYKEYFQSKGFETFVSETKEQTLNLIKQEQPDIAVIDIKLQNSSGLEILSEAKKLKTNILTIMLTGLIEEPLKEAALKLGADCYLEKPLTITQLETYIQMLAKQKGGT